MCVCARVRVFWAIHVSGESESEAADTQDMSILTCFHLKMKMWNFRGFLPPSIHASLKTGTFRNAADPVSARKLSRTTMMQASTRVLRFGSSPRFVAPLSHYTLHPSWLPAVILTWDFRCCWPCFFFFVPSQVKVRNMLITLCMLGTRFSRSLFMVIS